jgi:hypothetical protein
LQRCRYSETTLLPDTERLAQDVALICMSSQGLLALIESAEFRFPKSSAVTVAPPVVGVIFNSAVL